MMRKGIKLIWLLFVFMMVIFIGQIASSNTNVSEVTSSIIFPNSAPRNTFMVFGNTYVKTPEKAQTSIMASINKAVEDADIDFVIIVGELTISAGIDQFNVIKYVMNNSPVPVYVTASNHDLVYDNGDWKTGNDDDYDRFRKMLKTETEYILSKGRSRFIMQSHTDSIGTDFTSYELAKLENNKRYDFVYQVTEVPLIAPINLTSKPVVGISGGNPNGVKLEPLSGRHVRVWPTENKINDDEDDYLIFKENEGFLVVDSYVDRSLNKSFKIIIDRSAGTLSVESL
ncbi:hypothetical protein [Allomuricauda sp. F6463D]|uniref:hypothetical protein n=1 Tax=Allomuricauda sp. F6463D TaxID=2926409 RepID=UPI001FF1FDF7|nr:hypothetical protein [Muricauda sp. F6463D]MCK0160533.1 hypothetical protein [Muricauda sp. F6463D]